MPRETRLEKKTRWDRLPPTFVHRTAEAAVRIALLGVPVEDVLSPQAAELVRDALRALQNNQWRVATAAQTRR